MRTLPNHSMVSKILKQMDITQPMPPSKQKVAFTIVPTPIGNMDDITLRALYTLHNVDVIACEDTRVTGKLLAHHTIDTRMICYNDFSTQHQRDGILQLIEQGKTVALVSDAGMPLISDPGYKLVHYLAQKKVTMQCLPGASAVTTALALSALPTDRFMFCGFLPPKSQSRQTILNEVKQVQSTLIFFESAKRLGASLQDMQQCLGQRHAAIMRELTKTYEEVTRGTLEELAQYYATHDTKGEIVIVVGADSTQQVDDAQLEELLRTALQSLSVKEAAEMVAKAHGLKRKDVYRKALSVAGKQ